MIACDSCQKWYHAECEKVPQRVEEEGGSVAVQSLSVLTLTCSCFPPKNNNNYLHV